MEAQVVGTPGLVHGLACPGALPGASGWVGGLQGQRSPSHGLPELTQNRSEGWAGQAPR